MGKKKRANKSNLGVGPGFHFEPRAQSRLKRVLGQIGVPDAEPFQPDPFQLKALERLKKGDCLVSAPTGSGKTWIAIQAIKEVIQSGGRAWYASPLKALSNAKYEEFKEEFGTEKVGIITGERRENVTARVIVGTTEILRNQLYDAMEQGEDLHTDLVVIDEAHYMGDPERGVVWEEIFIYLPVRVKLLLLSATIPNASQIAGWLTWLRGKKCYIIRATKRPVPLVPLFLMPDGEIVHLQGKKGLSKRVKNFLDWEYEHRIPLSGTNLIQIDEILYCLRTLKLLPAIFFMKSRADCNQAIEICLSTIGRKNFSPRPNTEVLLKQLLAKYPFLSNHSQLRHILDAGVGAHHGGQLTHWKILIETLMKEGCLDAIFATSTVAAGVDFPARTVVIMQSDRYNGKSFVPLTATELHQMTGRAGRRGKDRIGFAVLVPGPYQDPVLMESLFRSPPEPIKSQVNINFSMVLNLLLSHRPEEIREMLGLSFGTYEKLAQFKEANKLRKDIFNILDKKLVKAHCIPSEGIVEIIPQRRSLFRRLRQLKETRRYIQDIVFKRTYLERGRLFFNHRNLLFCVIEKESHGKKEGVRAVRVLPKIKPKGGKLKTRWVSLDNISTILDGIIDLSPDLPLNQIIYKLKSASRRQYRPISREKRPMDLIHPELDIISQEISSIEKALKEFPCESCPHFDLCYRKRGGGIKKLLRQAEHITRKIDYEKNRLWNSFYEHLLFLRDEGFVDDDYYLTSDGVWASQLRLDQPLLVAECIRKNIFPDNDPKMLAALMAALVADEDRRVEKIKRTKDLPSSLFKAFFQMVETLRPLQERMRVRGFHTISLPLWATLTLYLWTNNKQWEEVIAATGLEEGDLSRLIFRTADNLRQLTSLRKTHSTLAKSAFEAITLLLREPVIIPT